jgi:hypothetical protein
LGGPSPRRRPPGGSSSRRRPPAGARAGGIRRARRSGQWHWLLVFPLVMPLLTPLYNHVEPTLWGVPFFYWYQLACAVMTMLIITAVYQLTKGRD